MMTLLSANHIIWTEHTAEKKKLPVSNILNPYLPLLSGPSVTYAVYMTSELWTVCLASSQEAEGRRD